MNTFGGILQGETVNRGRNPISSTTDKPKPRQRAKQIATFQRPNAKRMPRRRAKHASHHFSDRLPSVGHGTGRNMRWKRTTAKGVIDINGTNYSEISAPLLPEYDRLNQRSTISGDPFSAAEILQIQWLAAGVGGRGKRGNPLFLRGRHLRGTAAIVRYSSRCIQMGRYRIIAIAFVITSVPLISTASVTQLGGLSRQAWFPGKRAQN